MVKRPVALTTAYLASSVFRWSCQQQFFVSRPQQVVQTTTRRNRSFATVIVTSFFSIATTSILLFPRSTCRITRLDASDLPLPSKRTILMMMSTSSSVSNNTNNNNNNAAAAADDDDAKGHVADRIRVPTTTISSSRSSSSNSSSNNIQTGYLNAIDAATLDEELMSTPGYTLDQLMELAGLAVAEAVYQVISSSTTSFQDRTTSILIICGPGNNGGDGLVAARHLYMFGFTNIMIIYPALHKVKHQHYINLITQCQDLGINISDTIPDDEFMSHYSIIIDAIFGFSFRGEPRPPYDTILEQLKSLKVNNNNNKNVATLAVDIPSGWNVNGDEGHDDDDAVHGRFIPDVLVSLTAPKLCAQQYKGRHFVGGRFLPPMLAQKYNISMPPYPGVAQVMEITSNDNIVSNVPTPPTTTTTTNIVVDRNWELEYANYLATKEIAEKSIVASPTPTKEDDGMTWEEQYAAYCAEKEAKLQRLEEEEEVERKRTASNR